MPDPRRNLISTGTLALAPAEAPEKWAVRTSDDSPAVEAHWGDWVRLAKRILEADALSPRPRGSRGCVGSRSRRGGSGCFGHGHREPVSLSAQGAYKPRA